MEALFILIAVVVALSVGVLFIAGLRFIWLSVWHLADLVEAVS